MKEDKTVPQLRFPEFTDAWKQRELNEIADTIDTGKSIFSKSNIGKFKILGSTGVIGFDEDYDYEGSFLLTARVGANAGNLYRSSGKVKITDNTVFIKSKFIDYLFYSLEKFNLKRLSFGTGQPLIKSSELKKLNISVPCDENEITKIEHFFITIDRTITLQQRKLNSLQKLKKGLLQKMFPKNGENIPEIRFPEFSDAWKQRKFSEVFEEYSEKKHPELPALTIIQGKGTILRDASDRNLLYDKANLASYKLVRKDDFIVHLRTFEGGLEKANSDGIVSPAYHIFHGKNTDTRFFYPFFRSKYFIDALLKPHVYGIRDGKSIDIEGMKTISFLVPSFEEQNKIGKFVETLDNTITLQQRKLESLQKLKKGLLQQMFI